MTLTDRRAAIQRLLTDPPANYAGAIDGRLGPQSLAAFQSLAAAGVDPAPVTDQSVHLPPPSTHAPIAGLQANSWPREADAGAFFGYPPSLTQVELPYPMHLFSAGGELVSHISCNVRVAASLRRIFAAILAHYGSPEAIHATGADVFDGIYNDRSVRGEPGKRSMHAYGAAIDLDAEDNPLGATHGRMPLDVVAIFEAESWRWGGRYTGRKDWMHFEACS